MSKQWLGDANGVLDSGQGYVGMGDAPRVLDFEGVCETGGEALEGGSPGEGIADSDGATT